ncbi:MAG: hypothetical protein WAM14_08020 [Candidatus Nitrosopolaris sp.]
MSNAPQETPDKHSFIMMGTANLFICHLPMFFAPNHSYQTILEVELPKTDNDAYLRTRNENPGKPLIITNSNPMFLRDIVNSNSFQAFASFADPDGTPLDNFIESTIVTKKGTVLFEPLNPNSQYAPSLTYYLYGSDSDVHLSHVLRKAPNFEQELDVILSGNISSKVKEPNFMLAKVLIPSLKDSPSLDESRYPKDPLTKKEYQVTMDDGTTGGISVSANFFINNWSLNGLTEPNMPGMNM